MTSTSNVPGDPPARGPRPVLRSRVWFAVFLSLVARGVGLAQEAPVVIEIRPEGNARVTARQLEQVMKTRVGERLDPALLEEDVRAVWARFGARMTVVPVEDPQSGGLILRLLLDEERLVTRVEVVGTDEGRAQELLEQVALDGERAMMESEVRERVAELASHLREEGHFFSRVDLSIEERGGETVARVDVEEGPRVAVDDIEFVGADHVDHDHLRDVMVTDETVLWLFKSYLRRDVLERDLVELQRYVRDQGFFDAEVRLDAIEFDDDREWADVRIRVDEGPLYRVESVAFEGASVLSEDELREGLRLRPGEPMRRRDLERDIRAIRDRYGAIGHVRAQVEAEVAYGEQGTSISILYRIDEGVQKRIRVVDIRGGVDTLDEVVRREVTLVPGDVASTEEVRRTEDRLRALTYFTDDRGRTLVHARLEETADPLTEDLVIDVEEARSGRFFVTAGATTDIGFFAGIELHKDNFDISDTPSSWNPIALISDFWNNEAFHGGGQRLHIRVLPGSEVTLVEISFLEPYLFSPDRHPWSLGVDLYNRSFRLFDDDYEENRLGLEVTLGKEIDDRWRAGPFVRIEGVDIDDVDDDAPDDVKDVEGGNFVPAVGVFVRYRDLDSLFRPTEGFEGGARYEILFADAFGNRLVLDGDWLFPLLEDDRGRHHLLALRSAVGAASGFGDELPFFERLVAGGQSGDFPIRGFEYRQVGPEEDGVFLGGLFAYSVSLEYDAPLYSSYDPVFDEENEILRGVVFLDLGSVEDGISDLLGRSRMSIGAGVRLRIPALGPVPIALDLGIPVLKESDDETELLSVRVSTRF